MKSRSVARAGGALSMWALSLMVGLGVSAEAGAQESEGFDIQTFRPAISPDSGFGVESAEVYGHLQPYGALFFDYSNNPLVLRNEDGTRVPVIGHRMTSHLRLGVGLFDRMQVDLAVPLLGHYGSSYGDRAIQGMALGRPSLNIKGNLLSGFDGPVGLGAMLRIGTGGNQSAFAGEPGGLFDAQIVANTHFMTPWGELVLAANTGIHNRQSRQFHDVQLGTNFTYGVGAQLEVIEDFMRVGVETFGSVNIQEPRRATSPLEGLIGASFLRDNGMEFKVGLGSGLVSGVGSARFRGFVGVMQSFDLIRAEEELAPTVAAECIEVPEDFTGPFDEEGCPITPESFTGCDNLVEEWAGPVDRWGCPVIDADGDGVLFWDDECPFEPVVFIGEEFEKSGCPNHDVDGDGIANTEDLCPLEPGLRVYSGCAPQEEEERVVRTEAQIEIRETIHFESDRAIIKPESYDLLDEVALVLRNNPDIRLVEIAGHTDLRGDDEYNMMLSDERAKAVREFLIDRGIRPARLAARGYGVTEPLVRGDSDQDHATNRRVEFRILEQGEE